MRVQVLGPVRLWRDGHEVVIGPAGQRATLALLAVAGGQPLSRPEMISALWNGRPPPSAVNIIHTYIKHLRRIVDPDRPARMPSRVIRAVGDGYVMDPSAIEIDLARFRELAAAATRAYGRGDNEAAAELFGKSLTLWSGEPFADIPALAAHPKATFLRGERRAALLRYSDVMTSLGSAGDLLPLLEDAVRGQPLDESMAAVFIRACQAAGQRARAFEAYHDLRRRLADDLGIDPSSELAAAHGALLDHERAAAGSGPLGTKREPVSAQAPGYVVPAQLPPANLAFAGRAHELERLDGLLAANGDQPSAVLIVAIHGPAGIGKTTLALHWAHRLAGRYPDGQLHVNLRGFGPTVDAMSTAEAARRFLDAFAVPPARIPADVDSQLDLNRSLLAGRRVLMVLDNARDAEQVRPLLPGAATCIVIVTSRQRLSSLVAGHGARTLTLELLPTAEASELLAHHIGGDRMVAEPAAVERIVRSCGHLPLALAVIAARAAANPGFALAAIAAELHRTRHTLDAFSDTDLATDVRAAFAWSYRALCPDAAALFRLLSLHPGPDIAAPAAAALVDRSVDRARLLLAQLTGAHLAAEHTPGRFLMHDLLRSYATELAEAHDTAAHRRAAARRLFDHYLLTAHVAAMLINPQLDAIQLPIEPSTAQPEPITDDRHAWAWFDAERPNLLASVNLAATTGLDQLTWQLAWTLVHSLYRQGHWQVLHDSQTTALRAARRLGNLAAQATSHRRLFAALTQLGRFEEATDHLQRSLELCAALGDTVGQAHANAGINQLYTRQGRHGEALPYARTAFDLYRSAGHLAGQAESLNAIAWDLAMLGHHEQALDSGRQAMSLLLRSGDRVGQAGAWDTIGYVQYHLGHHSAAIDSYQRAIKLLREVGERYAESISWLHLGDAYQAMGDSGPTRDAWRRALDILDRLGHPDAEQAHQRLGTRR